MFKKVIKNEGKLHQMSPNQKINIIYNKRKQYLQNYQFFTGYMVTF